MKNSVLWIIFGVLLIIGGFFALMNPFVATVAAEQMAAWIFIFGGVLQFFAAFKADGWGARLFLTSAWGIEPGAACATPNFSGALLGFQSSVGGHWRTPTGDISGLRMCE